MAVSGHGGRRRLVVGGVVRAVAGEPGSVDLRTGRVCDVCVESQRSPHQGLGKAALDGAELGLVRVVRRIQISEV
jgi:hypothetical protein